VHVELTETQRELREAVRSFTAAKIAPAAAEIDRRGEVPRELLVELAHLGVLGCFVPEAQGGAGLDTVAYALAIEELARGSAAVAAMVATHTALVVWPILSFGTDEQQARCLPRLVRGEWLGCWAHTSIDGIDPTPPVLARHDDPNYVLNGHCRAVTNAPDADFAIVFASLDGYRGGDYYAPFLVETTNPGWGIEEIEPRMGLAGARAGHVALTYCRAPRGDRLGVETSGYSIARLSHDFARIASAALTVGLARGALEEALAYAQQRRAFGQALADFQGLQWRLADMATGVEAARLLVLRAASLRDRGLSYSREAATARLFAAENAMRLATQAVQMHGGYGYTREFAVERLFRDASVVEGGAHVAEEERVAIGERLVRVTP
jgi:alkylation response protein AidB-like acyl-CoA dehydrogenase